MVAIPSAVISVMVVGESKRQAKVPVKWYFAEYFRIGEL